MQFETIQDLPATIQDTLPKEAQEIYRKAYNDAWERFDQDAGVGLDQQGLAHQQAWGAVNQEFVLDLDQWHRRGEPVEQEATQGLLAKIKSWFKK